MHTFMVHTPYKKVVKSLRYKNPSYIAQSILRILVLKQSTLAEVMKVCTPHNDHSLCINWFCIGCESRMCITVQKEASSIFALYDHHKAPPWIQMAPFMCWVKAPTLYKILEAASQRSRSSTSSLIGVLMAAGILLKHRNQQIGLLQTITSIILYTGHASKKVC